MYHVLKSQLLSTLELMLKHNRQMTHREGKEIMFIDIEWTMIK